MACTNLIYETKCRRCGKFNEWFSRGCDMSNADAYRVEWLNFTRLMADMLAEPRQIHCPGCKKPTIQDVVSYSEYIQPEPVK